MTLFYRAHWNRADTGKVLRVTSGELSDADIQEAIERKEDRESIDYIPVQFDSATVVNVDI